MRLSVGPDGIFRSSSADGNAVIRSVTLVWTIGAMRGPNEQRRVRIVAWQVVNRWASLLLQPKRSCRFGNDPPSDRDANRALNSRNCDRMVRVRHLPVLAVCS